MQSLEEKYFLNKYGLIWKEMTCGVMDIKWEMVVDSVNAYR